VQPKEGNSLIDELPFCTRGTKSGMKHIITPAPYLVKYLSRHAMVPIIDEIARNNSKVD